MHLHFIQMHAVTKTVDKSIYAAKMHKGLEHHAVKAVWQQTTEMVPLFSY